MIQHNDSVNNVEALTNDSEKMQVSAVEKAIELENVITQSEVVRDWSEEEETRVTRKLDLSLLLLLMIGHFCLQIDKANIAYAATTSFPKDIGINNDIIGYGNQLAQAGIVIFEIPFNMILSRIGPAHWLLIQMFCWGSIALCQAALTNRAGFYATRFLLGMWEAGYLAACLTILAGFYKRKQMAMRITLIYISNYFSAAIGGLLAAAIFTIKSSALKKWQLLFLIEGSFTGIIFIVFIFVLPKSPTDTRPLVNWKPLDMFSDRERHIINRRVILDDPRKIIRLTSIGFRRVLWIMTDYRLWGHFAINLVYLTPKGGLGYYGPLIIKRMGFSVEQASALTSVPHWGVCIFALAVAWLSDRISSRGPLCLLCSGYAIIFSGVMYSVAKSKDVWKRYAFLALLNSGVGVAQSINDAWLSVNTDDPQVRCVGLAMAVAGSNLGGLAGINLFKEKDAPAYSNGFLGIVCLYASSAILITLMIFVYWNTNRRLAKDERAGEIVTEQGAELVRAEDGKAKVKNQL